MLLKGLPVSGKKSELIERLQRMNEVKDFIPKHANATTKPKPWQRSDAKKELKRALLDPTSSIHKMSVDEIFKSNNNYKQYPNFLEYYKNLKE